MSYGWLFSGNKISDRGCQHIVKGDWPQLKRVSIRIPFNISEGCGIREEGCRSIGKQTRYFKYIDCRIAFIQVLTITLEWLDPTSLLELLKKSKVAGIFWNQNIIDFR